MFTQCPQKAAICSCRLQQELLPMRDEHEARSTPELLGELLIVERRQQGLAETSREHHEGTTPAVVTRSTECFQCFDLNLVRWRRWREWLQVDLTDRERAREPFCSFGVRIHPIRIQNVRAGPKLLECADDPSVRMWISLALDPKVPFHAAQQRRP